MIILLAKQIEYIIQKAQADCVLPLISLNSHRIDPEVSHLSDRYEEDVAFLALYEFILEKHVQLLQWDFEAVNISPTPMRGNILQNVSHSDTPVEPRPISGNTRQQRQAFLHLMQSLHQGMINIK